MGSIENKAGPLEGSNRRESSNWWVILLVARELLLMKIHNTCSIHSPTVIFPKETIDQRLLEETSISVRTEQPPKFRLAECQPISHGSKLSNFFFFLSMATELICQQNRSQWKNIQKDWTVFRYVHLIRQKHVVCFRNFTPELKNYTVVTILIILTQELLMKNYSLGRTGWVEKGGSQLDLWIY